MAESKLGAGDPVIVQFSKEQVTFSKGGVPITAGGIAHESQHDGDSLANSDNIDIVVYFPDKTGVQVKVRDGQNIEAGELFELVKDVMKFPDEAREAFSLWLVSDLLELQLKPNHVPFKLVCYWEELLEKYTTASEEHQQRDEPIIAFRRNVFYPLESEKKINDPELLRYLYAEARNNILEGRYPLSQDQCDAQAGIQALIMSKDPEQEISSASSSFKSRLNEFLPPHFCKRHWIYKTRENPERRLVDAFNRARDTYTEYCVEDLYRTYLKLCQDQPYYGAAFFRGQAEHPVKGIVSKVLSTKDDPVYVAINVDGVYIIDMDDVALLIGFNYEILSWQFVESSRTDNNPNCLPCLFLQFPSSDKKNETKLLQIFSREAILMDNIIEACVWLKKTQGSTKSPDQCQVEYGKGTLAETFSRLALMTFSAEGKRIHSTVRHPKQSTSVATTAAPV